ncbi:hypothetical protein BWK59_14250 [Flavobacterium davisii]|uniref:Lipoprotein n=1 Tax=Flavobacterium davisii TaxID=2906077 RepID=A0A2D0AI83_9FLAO|nr:hypothetical protein [Flavobacterium davisii]OWP82740.1 hypothetical protein BWK59_14250 [Flavobacterium davisii]
MRKNHLHIECYFLTILFFFSLISCEKKIKPKEKEIIKETKDTTSKIIPKIINKGVESSYLKGIWINDDNPVFEINKDSIYYIDEDKSYKYILTDNTIKIYFDNYTYQGIVDFKNNKKTLIIKDSININTYHKEQEE